MTRFQQALKGASLKISTCGLLQIVGMQKGIFFMYDTWRYLKNCENASDLKKSGNSDKKHTLKKILSSLNRHKIKTYKYRIDFKSGNKAEIHQNYFMGSDMMIQSLLWILWQFITKRSENQSCKYVYFFTKLDVSCFHYFFSNHSHFHNF